MYSKGNYKQGEKTTLRMGENNSKWITASETTDKELISKIYKQLIQLNTRKTIQAKVGKRPKKTLLQRRHTDGLKKHMKKCSTVLIIREMQIKTTMRYHLTLVRMAIIKKSANNKCWGGCGEGMLLPCWWECELIQPLWKMVWRVLKKLGIKPQCDSAIPLVGIYPEENKIEKTHVSYCSLQHYLH